MMMMMMIESLWVCVKRRPLVVLISHWKGLRSGWGRGQPLIIIIVKLVISLLSWWRDDDDDEFKLDCQWHTHPPTHTYMHSRRTRPHFGTWHTHTHTQMGCLLLRKSEFLSFLIMRTKSPIIRDASIFSQYLEVFVGAWDSLIKTLIIIMSPPQETHTCQWCQNERDSRLRHGPQSDQIDTNHVY